MFKSFGLKMEPGSMYAFLTRKSLHISGVGVEKGDIAKIYIKIQKQTFILATVSQQIPQASLDLNFSGGEQITFTAKGNATVSLLGYWIGTDFSDNEEPLKVKVVQANAEKGAKEQNSVASEEEEDSSSSSSGDQENESGEEETSDSDEEEEVEPPKAKIVKLSPRPTAMTKKFKE